MSLLRTLIAHGLSVLALVGFVGLTGCESGFGESCSSNGDCKGSLTCVDWPCVEDESMICSRTCEQTCETDEECPSNRFCSARLCVRGTRGDSGPTDSMTDDAGEDDAGAEDAGEELDAGGEDAGEDPDAGEEPDAGADPDAGAESDAGASDAGMESDAAE